MTRIAVVMVGTDLGRFRDVEANKVRLALAREIAAFTQGKGKADIVMLARPSARIALAGVRRARADAAIGSGAR